MTKAQKYNAKVTNIEQLSWKVSRITLEYVNFTTLEAEPGQFVNLEVDTNVYRAYSICSDCKNTENLQLIIETGHEGKGSNFVKALKVGDPVNFIGPSGRYRLKYPTENKMVFFATGTGLAPFIPMFYFLKDNAPLSNIKVLFGSRNENEVLYEDVLDYFSTEMPNFSYEIYISGDRGDNANESYKSGRVNQNIDSLIDNSTNYYICGHPLMVKETREIIASKGVSPENIITEEFTHSTK